MPIHTRSKVFDTFVTVTGDKSQSWQKVFSTLLVHVSIILNLQKRCSSLWYRYQRKTLFVVICINWANNRNKQTKLLDKRKVTQCLSGHPVMHLSCTPKLFDADCQAKASYWDVHLQLLQHLQKVYFDRLKCVPESEAKKCCFAQTLSSLAMAKVSDRLKSLCVVFSIMVFAM